MLSLHGSKLFAHPKHSPKNFPDFAYIYILHIVFMKVLIFV